MLSLRLIFNSLAFVFNNKHINSLNQIIYFFQIGNVIYTQHFILGIVSCDSLYSCTFYQHHKIFNMVKRPPFHSSESDDEDELEQMQQLYASAAAARKSTGKTSSFTKKASNAPYKAMPLHPRHDTPTPIAKNTVGMPKSIPPFVSPQFQAPIPCPSNSSLLNHDEDLNMHIMNTITSQRLMIRNCVRTQLFRRLKFFKKDIHGMYDTRKGSVCALIIQNCNASEEEATLFWWSDMRKLVARTHTDHRNNVIKTIRMRFHGKLFKANSFW